MENVLKSIENSLKNKNWYSALVLSLILPDICGRFEDNNKSSSQRYTEWFEKYLGKEYKDYLSGNDCYALRCSLLHEGMNEITQQRARELLNYIVFIPNGSHRVKMSNNFVNDAKYDGKETLLLSVLNFSQDMIEATKQWIKEKSPDTSEMLEIHENGFSVSNGAIFIK